MIRLCDLQMRLSGFLSLCFYNKTFKHLSLCHSLHNVLTHQDIIKYCYSRELHIYLLFFLLFAWDCGSEPQLINRLIHAGTACRLFIGTREKGYSSKPVPIVWERVLGFHSSLRYIQKAIYYTENIYLFVHVLLLFNQQPYKDYNFLIYSSCYHSIDIHGQAPVFIAETILCTLVRSVNSSKVEWRQNHILLGYIAILCNQYNLYIFKTGVS